MKYIKTYEITKKYHNRYKEGDFIIVDMESVMTDGVNAPRPETHGIFAKIIHINRDSINKGGDGYPYEIEFCKSGKDFFILENEILDSAPSLEILEAKMRAQKYNL